MRFPPENQKLDLATCMLHNSKHKDEKEWRSWLGRLQFVCLWKGKDGWKVR